MVWIGDMGSGVKRSLARVLASTRLLASNSFVIILVVLTGCGLSQNNAPPELQTKKAATLQTNAEPGQLEQVEINSSKFQLRTNTKAGKNMNNNEAKKNKLGSAALESSLEPVSAFVFTDDNIQASVISHGCTSSNNFVVQHEINNDQCVVSIVRTKPDLCRRAPFIADINIAWSLPASCESHQLVLANPVLETPSPDTLIKQIK